MIKVTEVPNGIQMVNGNVFVDREMVYSTETGTNRRASEILVAAAYIEEAARRNGHDSLLYSIGRLKFDIREIAEGRR